MFTGLVETTGVVRVAQGTSPRRLTIASTLPPDQITIGDSIAIDGCCLTVVAKGADGLTFEAATETLERTTMGQVRPGIKVNLERAMRADARLDGHLVMGHVDAAGELVSRTPRGSATYLGIRVTADISRFVASQGCVALAGVSLTVTDVADDTFYVGLIPHTLTVTTLGDLAVGGRVNVEVDILARYVARWLQTGNQSALTVQHLKDRGFA